MAEFLQQVVSGLASGAIFASLALALVLIYRATDVVNFSQGEMATFTTYVAWSLMNHGFSYWPAFALTLAFAFIGGVAVERIAIRRRERVAGAPEGWIAGRGPAFRRPIEELDDHEVSSKRVTLLRRGRRREAVSSWHVRHTAAGAENEWDKDETSPGNRHHLDTVAVNPWSGRGQEEWR